MNIRNEMVVALVKEVLGPRNGPYEVLPEEQDPFSEYITGVLQPPVRNTDQLGLDERIEDAVDNLDEEISSEEDQQSEGYAVLPGIFTPALDPRALAHSIGISFIVESDAGHTPQIAICATWGRYHKEADGWHRQPYYFLQEAVDATIDRQEWREDNVRIFLRTRKVNNARWKVSLFLVNETPVAVTEKRPDTSKFVFQPQIRVNLSSHTHLVPVDIAPADMNERAFDDEDPENLNLSLLYREHRARARGHMCAAMWKEIDPERPFEDESQRPPAAPFIWTDAKVVPEPHRSRFTAPDIRTELVPVYPVMAPEMDWPQEYGAEPELRPDVLAETWSAGEIYAALQPLIGGYERWIQQQRSLIETLSGIEKETAERNLRQCQLASDRMQEAMRLLMKNDNARLAFCFANKAIAMQAQWKGIQMKWRPFQLAFILLNLPAIVDLEHRDRNTCDLLWFPTGGGKTEAYLGLIAFTLAFRRLRARNYGEDDLYSRTGGGTGVISRYTLRLLTIQQFRRALGVITACEMLRVQGLKEGKPAGWRPEKCQLKEDFLWGKTRFSIGLWVGGGVTPNRLQGFGPIPVRNGKWPYFAGALDILKGLNSAGYDGLDGDLKEKAREYRVMAEGEPAQITNCPVCDSILSIPSSGLQDGIYTLHFIYSGGSQKLAADISISLESPGKGIEVLESHITRLSSGYRTLSVKFLIPPDVSLSSQEVDSWWYDILSKSKYVSDEGRPARITAVRPSRPGYFLLSYPQQGPSGDKESDFEIHCPNPACELNKHEWVEAVPVNRLKQRKNIRQSILGRGQQSFFSDTLVDENLQDVLEVFRVNNAKRSWSIPISAYTVDDQVYRHVPSVIIATVDKFARLAYEEAAASLFGNVTHYHSRFGYYREGCPPFLSSNSTDYQPHPPREDLRTEVKPFEPPDLILQDELHLIEGPLGSMVGLYETAIDLLSQQQVANQFVGPKYIASTATVRQAESQVASLFNRDLFQFPPFALNADDRFFARSKPVHPLDTSRPGRLYAGIAAPGKGAQTPIIRIWSALLNQAEVLRKQVDEKELDPFWTLVGYFNALRELAGALSLYRQDIQQWLRYRGSHRDLDESRRLELSSRMASTDLPSRLKMLEKELPSALDAVLSTSMFGTGVDVSRLSLMVVHGQPKTTASYIQATGRVGRSVNGLVVTFLRATRPRDLDHYEFFTGYHAALYRYVEPVTVAPFSPRARDRGLGPLAVILLRQARQIAGTPVPLDWRVQQRLSGKYHARAYIMSSRRHEPEVRVIPELFERRAQSQPDSRRPAADQVKLETESELDRWYNIARKHQNDNDFVYYEYAMLQSPSRHVVLGDAQHRNRFDQAFENAPNSLRDVEETTGFKD